MCIPASRSSSAGSVGQATILDRIVVLEQNVLGMEQPGGAIARILALEEAVLGAPTQGPLPARVKTLEEAMGIPSP